MRYGVKLSALFAAAFMTTNCGGSSGGGGGDKDGDGGGDVALDVSQLAAADLALRDDGNEPVWIARLFVGDNSRLNLQGASFAAVQEALSAIKLKASDAGRLELVATSGAKVLATNLQDVAYSNEDLKPIWDSECQAISPAFSLADAKIVDQDGKKQAQLNIGLCDFVGMWVTPTVSVQPQKVDSTTYKVIYKCKFNIESTYTSSMSQYVDVLCEYGYTTQQGEQAPEITVPVEYAPTSEFYEAHRLKLDNFSLEKLANGRPYDLNVTFGALPFGSHAGCNQQKLDLFYSDAGNVKQTRANYKRHHATDGSVVWVLENEAALPRFDAVMEYYRGAAANSRTVTLYRVCDWSPSTMANASGDTARM